MNARTTIGAKRWLTLLWSVALLAAAGCVRDDEACGGNDARGTYMMSVTVVTSTATPTRAGHTDDREEQGTDPENYIDFDANDFRIVLFDNAGNYLHEMDGRDKWTRYPASVGDTRYVYYQMECEIEFPDEVSNEQREQIRSAGMQVLVLANWESAGGSYERHFASGSGYQTIAQIWKDAANYNFAYNPAADGRTWRPDHTAEVKRLIPMFGYAKVSKFEPRASNGMFYSGVTIPMQRAIAKIEVIDHLENQPSLKVDDVTLTGYNTSGRFIPDVAANPDWNKVGSQVGSSSLPSGVTQQSGLKFFHDNSNRKWIAYVPEMALSEPQVDAVTKVFDPESDAAKARPHLEVKIASDLDYYEGGTYPAHFARYNQNFEPTIPDPSWNHILRNHIYRFSVNKVGLSVNLHLHVKPWDADDDEEWDFTDHVTVQQMLDWNPTTYSRRDEDTGEVTLQVENGKSLEGSFRISTPLNGRWYARLTPIGEAKTNAISFVDKDGNVLQPSSGDPAACLEISGLIDTQNEVPTVFYIRPTNNGNEQESMFRLEFFVENLGVWMEVPMTEGGKYKYYTIVRPANIIE